jgi:large subunit ribosomal protein L6
MSRIGQAPIPIPSGVEVNISGASVRVKGPKGELEQRVPEGVKVEQADSEIRVERADDERETRALHGLVRSLVFNMVQGVTQGFEKSLEIQGVGYRA